MTDNDWTTLLDRIRMGACTPFIGAGACRPVLPGAQDLAEQLLTEEETHTGKTCPLLDRKDLAKVTQFLAVTHQDGPWAKSKIAERILSAGRPDFAGPEEPHGILADLPLPIYLTTNYDDFMVQALASRGRSRFKREICRWNRSLIEEQPSAFDDGYEPSVAEPVVFHLHGRADLFETMVASEDDYLDFLVNISKDLAFSPASERQKAMLPGRIRRAIKNSTLLFVGYGLADVNFRVILRGLVGSLEPSGRHLHLTVQYPDCAEEIREYLEEYFHWTLDLKVFWGSSRDFATELRQRWEAHP